MRFNFDPCWCWRYCCCLLLALRLKANALKSNAASAHCDCVNEWNVFDFGLFLSVPLLLEGVVYYVVCQFFSYFSAVWFCQFSFHGAIVLLCVITLVSLSSLDCLANNTKKSLHYLSCGLLFGSFGSFALTPANIVYASTCPSIHIRHLVLVSVNKLWSNF